MSRASRTRRRPVASLAALALLSLVLPIAPSTEVDALTVGAPTNATARTGNEDESAIAVNPNDNQQIAVMTNGIAGDAGLPLSISTDGGQTWTRTVFATGTGAGGDGRPVACCDPTLAWDDFGNLYLGYLQRTATRSIELFVTTDLGTTFTNLGPVDTQTNTTNLDQPTVVAAEGALWVTWRDDSGGISARGRSVTGLGAFGAWNAEQDISNVGNFGDIAIGPDGEVMVVYQTPTGNEGPSNIIVHTDSDGLGAGGFGGGVTVTSTNVGGFDFLPAQPQRSVDAEAGLAWDRTGGTFDDRIYLVYTDENPNESNDFDIVVRWSDDDGANWSAPVQVNDDAGTNSQMLPRISLDQTSGQVAVTFYDARGDDGSGPNAVDVDGNPNNDVTLFGSWSDDGGATWAANFAIADAPTDGYNYNGAQELGDYTGAAFHDGILYPSWADSSNSTGDNPDGARASLDVYTAAIHINNVQPTVGVDPVAGDEGDEIVLAGSASDPNGDPLTYSWTVMPGAGNDPGSTCVITSGADTLTPTVRCSDDGTFTAELTATGDPGGPVSASNTVTVGNVAPDVTSATTTPVVIDEGQSTTFSASFSDPGWNDTYTASIDWGYAGFAPPEAVVPSITDGGPGVPDSGTFGGTRAYLDDGSFAITGTVSDDDLGSDSATRFVTVQNVDPTAVIDQSGTVLINGVPTIVAHAGDTIPFSGRSTDPGSDDLTLTWDWDDGPPAPDIMVTSLANPPGLDPDPSPDGVPRDITDDRVHVFGDACFYDVVFASADDDGGSASDDIAVVIVGNYADTRSHGYWKNEMLQRRRADHSVDELQCLLDIVGFMSQVFDEHRNASTPSLAATVMNSKGSSAANDLLDVQLLAAWLNFADGRVELTDLVDTNFDGAPDTVFSELVAQAEAVRLAPSATRDALLAQKTRLDSFNNSGI